MIREPSRHDGLAKNQAARDLQRERQRQERAQMVVSDEAGLSPNIQDLFNAPVKVKPSVEDQTSIEIRKTFGSYDSARPFLTDQNGLLQRRLIGVDQTVNTISGGASTSGSGGDHRPAASSGSNPNALLPQKPHPVIGNNQFRPLFPTTSSTNNTAKSDYHQSVTKHIPQPIGIQSSQKGPVPIVPSLLPHSFTSLSYIPGQGSSSVPSLNPIQHLTSAWNLPTPVSPFPVRRNNKLSTTTLPITFVNTSSLNTATTVASDVSSDLYKAPVPKSNHNPLTAASTSLQSCTTATISPSFSSFKSEVKPAVNLGSSVGALNAATVKEKAGQLHTFKKPLERNDSSIELDNILREMTGVTSPLAAILPKENSPKKSATRRPTKGDDRMIEGLDGVNDTKVNLSPRSTTGMNSSSSSSETDSSDSDSDSGSSSESELTTPSTTPVKKSDTTRSPTERESWGLSSFFGGNRKESALIEAASSSLDCSKNDVGTLETPNSEGIKYPEKQESNFVAQLTSAPSSTKCGSTTITAIPDSKALTKSSGFAKSGTSQLKSTNKEAASFSKGTNLYDKATVLPRAITALPPTVKISAALLTHKDPTLSGSSSEDEASPPVVNHATKEKTADKTIPKNRVSAKRRSTTPADSATAKKARRITQPAPVVTSAEKPAPKPEEKQARIKSLDRNKNDMIGKLFRLKKEKTEESTREKEKDTHKDVAAASIRDREDKTGDKLRRKSSPVSNRVSAKDSGRKRSSSPGQMGVTPSSKTNGESKSILEKVEKEIKLGQLAKSRRSSSPTKGVAVKPSGVSNIVSNDKSEKLKHPISKPKKQDREPTKSKPVEHNSKPKSGTTVDPKGKSSSDSKQPKPKQSSLSPKHNSKSSTTKTSTLAVVTKPSKANGSSRSSKSSSSKGAKVDPKSIMPPPPPPPPAQSHSVHNSHKESRGSKKDPPKSVPTVPPPPSVSSFVIRIPLKALPRPLKPSPTSSKKPDVPPQPVINNITKSTDGKTSRDDKKMDAKVTKSQSGNPSLVGSSVEDLTDSQVVPKTHRPSGGSDQLKPITKDHSVSNNFSKSHKRGKNRSSHEPSKKPRLKQKEVDEVEVKAPPEKPTTDPTAISAFTGAAATTAAKTPPEPPDSSLNPAHAPSPPTPQPQYFSYFEKIDHQEDLLACDQSYCLTEAKRLKHKADKEDSGLPQTLTYMDSALYFILTGLWMERMGSVLEALELYEQTFMLIRNIAVRPRPGTLGDDIQEVKLLVLTFRVQSLLSMQLYKAKAREISDTSLYLSEHLDPKNCQEAGIYPVTHSPRTSLNTPSPLSPVLSPAGSGPASVGSGTTLVNSPHHPTQQHIAIPKHIYQKFTRFVTSTSTLITAHDLWKQADLYVERYQVQDFVISIDRIYGPLSLYSSLPDLVRYVRYGLKNLNQHLQESS